MPTPPAAAWINTRSPGSSEPNRIEPQVCGQVVHRDGGALLEGERVGQGGHVGGLGRHPLGVAAEAGAGHHAVAHATALDPVADGGSPSRPPRSPRRVGGLGASGYRPTRAIRSAKLIPAALTSTTTSPGPALGLGALLDLQHLGRPVLGEHHRSHGCRTYYARACTEKQTRRPGRPPTTFSRWRTRRATGSSPGTVTAVPFLGLVVVGWQLWESALHWHDLVVFLIVYVAHRPRGHGGLSPPPDPPQLQDQALAAGHVRRPGLGRDRGPGDLLGRRPPQAPRLRRPARRPAQPARRPRRRLARRAAGPGPRPRRLAVHTHPARREGPLRARPDRGPGGAIRGPHVRAVGDAGPAVPFGLGLAIGGSLDAGLTGLLWGGAVRMLVLHHVTYSINSLCHFFGRRRFDTDDESRNLLWLAPLSFGESWHNNHHAFPTSARHGLRPWEIDISAMVIRGLEAVGLAWDVQRVPPERQLAKAGASA